MSGSRIRLRAASGGLAAALMLCLAVAGPGAAQTSSAVPAPPVGPSCDLVAQFHAADLQSLAVAVGDKLDDPAACAILPRARYRAAAAEAMVGAAASAVSGRDDAEAAVLYRRAAVTDRSNASAIAGAVATTARTRTCALGARLTRRGLIGAANRAWPQRPGSCGPGRLQARRSRGEAIAALGTAAAVDPGSQAQIDALIDSTRSDATLSGADALRSVVAAMPAPAEDTSVWTTWREWVTSAWEWITDTFLRLVAFVATVVLLVVAVVALITRIPPLADWLADRPNTRVRRWFGPRMLLSGETDADAEFVGVVATQVGLLHGPRSRLPLEMRSAAGDDATLKALATAVAEVPHVGKLAAVVMPALRFLRPGIVIRGTVRRLVVTDGSCEGVSLTLGRYGRGTRAHAIYAHDYDPAGRLSDVDDPPAAHLRQGALAVVAAVWFAYRYAELIRHETHMETALGSAEWRSAARQRAGLEWYQDREREQAVGLFAEALELDPGNRFARLNLGVAIAHDPDDRLTARGHLTAAIADRPTTAETALEPVLPWQQPPRTPPVASPGDGTPGREASLRRAALLAMAVADANEIAAIRTGDDHATRVADVAALIADARIRLDSLDALLTADSTRDIDADDPYAATVSSLRATSYAVRAHIEAEDGRGEGAGGPSTGQAWVNVENAVRVGRPAGETPPPHRPGTLPGQPWPERVARLPIDGRAHYNLACALTVLAGGAGDHEDETRTMAKAHLAEALRSTRRRGSPADDPALRELRDADPVWFASRPAAAQDHTPTELARLPYLTAEQAAALRMYGVVSRRDLLAVLSGEGPELPAAFAADVRRACTGSVPWLLARMGVDDVRLLHEVGADSRDGLARWSGRVDALRRLLATAAASLKVPVPDGEAVSGWVDDAAGVRGHVTITAVVVEEEPVP